MKSVLASLRTLTALALPASCFIPDIGRREVLVSAAQRLVSLC